MTPQRNPLRHSHRGISILELMAASAVVILVAGSLVGLSRISNAIWYSSFGRFGTQNASQLALGRIAPSLRVARLVETGSSSSSRLTVRLPRFQNGSLVLPLENGDLHSFYLSDTTGRTDRSGSVLWRSVNGVIDREWAYIGNRPRVEAVPGSLNIEYSPSANDPTSVSITLTTVSTSFRGAHRFTTSETFMIRNKGL